VADDAMRSAKHVKRRDAAQLLLLLLEMMKMCASQDGGRTWKGMYAVWYCFHMLDKTASTCRDAILKTGRS